RPPPSSTVSATTKGNNRSPSCRMAYPQRRAYHIGAIRFREHQPPDTSGRYFRNVSAVNQSVPGAWSAKAFRRRKRHSSARARARKCGSEGGIGRVRRRVALALRDIVGPAARMRTVVADKERAGGSSEAVKNCNAVSVG